MSIAEHGTEPAGAAQGQMTSGQRFSDFFRQSGQSDGLIDIPPRPEIPSEGSPADSAEESEPVEASAPAPPPAEAPDEEPAAPPKPAEKDSGGIDPKDLEELRRLGISDELLGDDALPDPEAGEHKPDIAALKAGAEVYYHKHGGDAVSIANDLFEADKGIAKREEKLKAAVEHFTTVVESIKKQASARVFDESAAYQRHLKALDEAGHDPESSEIQELAQGRALRDKQKFDAEAPAIPEDISQYVENLVAKREQEAKQQEERQVALNESLRQLSLLRDGSPSDLLQEWTTREFFTNYTTDPAELRRGARSSFEAELTKYLLSEGASTGALKAAIKIAHRRVAKPGAPAEPPAPAPTPEPMAEQTPPAELRNPTSSQHQRPYTPLFPTAGETAGDAYGKLQQELERFKRTL